MDRQASGAHQAPGPSSDIALHDDLAARHFVADPVQALASPLDPNLSGVTHVQAKNVSNHHAPSRRLQFDSFDLPPGHAGQPMRRQGRKIEALLGTFA